MRAAFALLGPGSDGLEWGHTEFADRFSFPAAVSCRVAIPKSVRAMSMACGAISESLVTLKHPSVPPAQLAPAPTVLAPGEPFQGLGRQNLSQGRKSLCCLDRRSPVALPPLRKREPGLSRPSEKQYQTSARLVKKLSIFLIERPGRLRRAQECLAILSTEWPSLRRSQIKAKLSQYRNVILV